MSSVGRTASNRRAGWTPRARARRRLQPRARVVESLRRRVCRRRLVVRASSRPCAAASAGAVSSRASSRPYAAASVGGSRGGRRRPGRERPTSRQPWWSASPWWPAALAHVPVQASPAARPRRSSHPKRHRAQAAPASSVPATARCSIKSAMLRPPRVDSSRYELPCHLRPLPQLSVRLLLTRSIVPLAARAAMAVPRTSAVSPLPGSSSYARNAPPAGPLGREGGGSGRRRRGRARPPGGIWEEGASRSRARPPRRAHGGPRPRPRRSAARRAGVRAAQPPAQVRRACRRQPVLGARRASELGPVFALPASLPPVSSAPCSRPKPVWYGMRGLDVRF